MNRSRLNGRAAGIAHVMKTEAAFENKPNHVRHVQHQIEYTDAMCEATEMEIKEWVAKEVPKMIRAEISKLNQNAKMQVKVDERSLMEAKKKITDMLKSIFH